MISSTPLRRSFIKKQTEPATLSPIVTADDDDWERRKRRSIYVAEQILQDVSEPNAAAVENLEQIKNHIKMCQKLFNENRINIHNAWEMKIIDYVNSYVSNNVANSEIILVASTTLDVCVKVYGYKVEYLGQEIVKLANTTHTQLRDEEDDTVVEPDRIEDRAVTKKAARAKRKKRVLTSNITKDRDTLLAELPKVAPTYLTVNIDINANNFDNMYTNRIPMDHAAYKFNLLNNEDCSFISYNAKHPALQEEPILQELSNIKSFIICPVFKTFDVDEDDHDYNDSIVNIINDNQSKIQNTIVNGVIYDENGIPVPDIDGSKHDIFADDAAMDDFVEENELVGQAIQRRVEMITSFCPTTNSLQKNNTIHTSHSDSFLATIWVGPSHWKNKLIRPSAPRYSGKSLEKVAQVKKKRKTTNHVKNTLINWQKTFEIVQDKKFKTKKIFCNVKKCTYPSRSLVILPEFDKLILLNLISKKEYKLDTIDPEFEHSPYDYNNADDSQYCSQGELADMNNDPQDNIESNAVDGNVNHPTGDNLNLNNITSLIDAPDVVTQSYVPYALRAKKVNMKQLKSAMLKCLMIDNNSENDADKGRQFRSSLFSTVYKTLPSKLPSKIRNEISVPLAFFSLLHLTNEFNLKLIRSEALDEIGIEKQ